MRLHSNSQRFACLSDARSYSALWSSCENRFVPRTCAHTFLSASSSRACSLLWPHGQSLRPAPERYRCWRIRCRYGLPRLRGRFLHERLNAIKVVGLIIAAAGIALVVDIRHGGNKLLAEAVAVAAGVAWAIGVIITKRLQTHEKPDLLSLTTWQMLFGGAVAAIAALIAGGPATQWSAVYIGALAYNAVLASALAYLMWIFALQHLPARDASIGTLANPVIGITAAWLQLGERPSLSEAMGMALVVAALLLLAFSSSAQQQGIADDKQA